VIRDAIKMACQSGAGNKEAALKTAAELLTQSAKLEKTSWTFDGTLHFLSAAPAFEQGRSAWVALFESLDKGDGAAFADALHQLQEVMKN
jgi:hypothetical protein